MNEYSEPSRENGLSSLDFAFWVHEGVESSYDRTAPFAFPEADYDGVEQEYDLIRDSLRLCGVVIRELEGDHMNLQEIMASNNFTAIPVDQAVRTRGAILFSGSRLAISMGFNYIVHFAEDRHVYRYIPSDEITKWSYGYLVKGLDYQ